MMFELICPECAAENSPDAENCWVCQASLAGVEPTDPEHLDGDGQDEKDLLPQADDDLTDLLHSLKQDDDLMDFPVADGEDLASSPDDAEDAEPQADVDDEDDVPEWLNRIRQRASTEADSVGEITQKIRTAHEILDEENKQNQRQQFESLIEKIHGEDAEQPLSNATTDGDHPDESDGQKPTDTDWLTRIRKRHGPKPGDTPQEQFSEREGDSLLQWLVALEEGVEEPGLVAETEPTAPSDEIEDTQEIKIASAALDATQEITLGERIVSKRTESALSISREEQNKADQLSATILDEKAPRPVREPEKPAFPRGIRLAMGVLLIAILSLALFHPLPAGLPSGTQGPENIAVQEWVDGLHPDSSLLLILDYQAGFSAEMALIAQPIFEQVLGNTREVSILSSTPVGGPLFYRLLDGDDLTEHLVVGDLGYYPVGSFGAYGLAHQALSEWQIRGQPAFTKALPSEPFDGILILGDDYEGAMAWVEQLSSLTPNTPIILLVSAQAGPLLLPYWESGQVMGMISGISDAVNLDEDVATLPNRWRAYQVGIVMMVLLLLIGVSLPPNEPHDAEGQDGR